MRFLHDLHHHRHHRLRGLSHSSGGRIFDNHYIVCGFGRVGENVMHELSVTRRDYVVIDTSQQKLHVEGATDTMPAVVRSCSSPPRAVRAICTRN